MTPKVVFLLLLSSVFGASYDRFHSASMSDEEIYQRRFTREGDAPPSEDDLVFVGSPLFPGPAAPGYSGAAGGHGMPKSPGAPYIPQSSRTRRGGFGGPIQLSDLPPSNDRSPVGEHGMPSSPGGNVDYGSPLYPGPAQPGFWGAPGGHGMPTSPGAPYIPQSSRTRRGGGFGIQLPRDPPTANHPPKLLGNDGSPESYEISSSPVANVDYGSPLYPGPAQPGFSGVPGRHGMPTSPGAPYIPQSSQIRRSRSGTRPNNPPPPSPEPPSNAVSPVGEHGMPSSPGGNVDYGSPLYPGPAQPGFSGAPGGHGVPTSPGAPYIPQSSRTRRSGGGFGSTGPTYPPPPRPGPPSNYGSPVGGHVMPSSPGGNVDYVTSD